MATAPVPNPGVPAFRIISIRERGGVTRTASRPTFIDPQASLDSVSQDLYFPEMVQVRCRGEWYLVRRESLENLIVPSAKAISERN